MSRTFSTLHFSPSLDLKLGVFLAKEKVKRASQSKDGYSIPPSNALLSEQGERTCLLDRFRFSLRLHLLPSKSELLHLLKTVASETVATLCLSFQTSLLREAQYLAIIERVT